MLSLADRVLTATCGTILGVPSVGHGTVNGGVRPVVKAGHDKHDAPRGPKPLPPGTRLGVLLDSGPPCGKTVTVSFVAAGVPLLGAPSFSVRPSMLPPQAESGAEEEARRQEREDEVFVHKLVQQVRLDLFARRKRRKEEEEALASPAGARSPASLGQKEEEDKKETEEEQEVGFLCSCFPSCLHDPLLTATRVILCARCFWLKNTRIRTVAPGYCIHSFGVWSPEENGFAWFPYSVCWFDSGYSSCVGWRPLELDIISSSPLCLAAPCGDWAA